MIEKILERLEAKKKEYLEAFRTHGDNERYGIACGFGDSIKIVQEVAKEYGNGWIPCSERLPKNDERILCLHSSGFIDCGDFICESWCCDMDEYATKKDEVIAWQPLPAPYEKGE